MESQMQIDTHQFTNFGAWSSVEDDQLLRAVEKFGQKNWKKIEIFVVGRNRKQCRERYFNSLMFRKQNNRPWMKQEDDVIMQMLRTVGNKWTLISKQLEGRSGNDVKNRYFGSLKRKMFTKPKNDVEDSSESICLTAFTPVDPALFSVI
ncbi:trichome differentiation protein GL1, putative [Entamoeba invadens IP1]|uniref:Trichome differentiation protein GL1, putative n=1 Tax=Entamoeba invadens IP1 TaxID=370355 RepID=A0A0A1TVN7_ENTIV|nr:trichome differentiation protein GL1, putative [Entamoeba invadens IP1]ELP84466.1 trichome differentiation protein GL1, putative [Entamoeba invadens IP1]|eukprot:XP_004183812.1 trichome differentiation protein GL1, putative [Entamoeba invadens IP1]